MAILRLKMKFKRNSRNETLAHERMKRIIFKPCTNRFFTAGLSPANHAPHAPPFVRDCVVIRHAREGEHPGRWDHRKISCHLGKFASFKFPGFPLSRE